MPVCAQIYFGDMHPHFVVTISYYMPEGVPEKHSQHAVVEVCLLIVMPQYSLYIVCTSSVKLYYVIITDIIESDLGWGC